MVSPKTLYDKIFDDHVISTDNTSLLYIDRQLVHEVTSPQAFEGLEIAKRKVRRPDLTLVTVDHNIPTTSRANFKSVETFVTQKESKLQCLTLQQNVKKFGLTYFGMDDKRQGIVHIIGPEQGFTLPGTTVVCGDSHTATHGAFGALAFGIGTSEVEHVLATQTLPQKKSKNMLIKIDGELLPGVTSKDVILHIIGVIGIAGGIGHVIEFAGSVIDQLSMEARMSMCNMSIEAGARAGMIAPDEITFDYLKGRPLAPKGENWEKAVKYWKTLKADSDAKYDITVEIEGKTIVPCVTWGTTPQDVLPITGTVPSPATYEDPIQRAGIERSLEYMGLLPGSKLTSIKIDKVFIGSCTNGRIEDLRSAALIAKGRKVSANVHALVVPGSGLVKKQAEDEGLADIFIDAGFDWREAGCSMCLGMNEDQLKPEERCASTSNRNFEGRQGFKGRTHLMSPAMAAAAAIAGHLTDVREYLTGEELSKNIDPKLYIEPLSESDFNTPSDGEMTKISTQGGGQEKFTSLKGIAAPFEISNVDTDKIIPKQFLKTIKRTGLGSALFYEIRYNPDGSEIPEFILNQPKYRNAKILVTGVNFGCGSSREHAPWALLDFGIRCIIAPSFADIFENNCTKNGMLPLTMPKSEVDRLMDLAKKGKEIEVDLVNQVVKSESLEFAFEINEFRKHCLVNGLDDISLTLQKSDLIDNFELKRSKEWPWLDGQQYGRRIEPISIKKQKTDW